MNNNEELKKWQLKKIATLAFISDECDDMNPKDRKTFYSMMEAIFSEIVGDFKNLTLAAEREALLLAPIRQALADYIASEGCSCCRDTDAHDEAMDRLGAMLKMDKYSDDSGYDYSKYRSKQ